MLFTLAIDESPVFEIGFGGSYVLKVGSFQVYLHRGYPGSDAPFSWETEVVDHEGLGGAEPWRCHDTTARFRSWELIASRSYPISETVCVDRETDDEEDPRPWTPRDDEADDD